MARNVLVCLTMWICGACSSGSPGTQPPPPPTTPTLVSISVAPDTLVLAAVGATGQLTATVRSTAGVVANPTVAWTSANPLVVTVSGTGTTATVTAVTGGTTRITATTGSLSASSVVVIRSLAPTVPAFDWRLVGAVPVTGTYGNNRWVALATGAAFVSTDGASWERYTASSSFTPVEVVWTGTRFVAMGFPGVVTSNDGITWTPATGIGQSPGSATLRRSIVWTGSELIASDNGNLFRSPNGTTWTAIPGIPTNGVVDLVWTGATLAGNVGAASGQTAVSSDTGRTWRVSQGLPSDLAGPGLAWDGTRFVKWRGRAFGTSADGLVWQELATTVTWPISGTRGAAAPVEDMVWSGDRYVALVRRSFNGVTLDGGAIVTSPDGRQWTEVATGAHGLLRNVVRTTAGLFVFGAATLQSARGDTWTMRLTEMQVPERAITWSIDRFLVLDGEGLLVSRDGQAWERTLVPTLSADAVVTWNGSLYIIGASSGRIFTSPDGVTWTTRQSGMSDNIRDILFASGRVVAMGQAGAVTTSTDGITWSGRTLVARQLQDLEWTGQRFVVSASDVTLSSPDGLTWQTSAALPSPVTHLVWTGAELLGMNRSRVVRSPDGLTWTLAGDIDQNASNIKTETITRVGSVLVACQVLSANLLYSTDARLWVTAATPEPIPSPCSSVAWSGQQLLVRRFQGLEVGSVRRP